MSGKPLGLQARDDGRPGVAQRQFVRDDELALRQQVLAGCALQFVFDIGHQLAMDDQGQRNRPRFFARLCRQQASHGAHLGAQGLGHVACQLDKKFGPGGGRYGGRHLQHRGLQLLLFLACAQAQDAEGQVVGQFLQQFAFFRADVQHLGGVQVQQAEGVLGRAQRQADHAMEAVALHAFGQAGIGRFGAHIAHDDRLARADGGACRPLARGVAVRPGQAQGVEIVSVAPRVGRDLDGFLRIVVRKAHPAQLVAANVHHDAADGLQQGGFRGGAHQGFVAAAQHVACTGHAGQFALRAQPLGHVGGHHLACLQAVEQDAA